MSSHRRRSRDRILGALADPGSGDAQLRILIVKLTSIGDVAHTIPSLFALARRWRNARFDWLVDPVAAQVVAALPWVDRIVEVDTLARRFRGRSWPGHLQGVRAALRQRGYDAAIDFQGLLRSSLWTVWSGASARLGRGRWPWLDRSVSMFDLPRTPHAIENTARVLRFAGIEPGSVASDFFDEGSSLVRDSLLANARRIALELALDARFWVWIPETNWPSKSLPPDGMRGVPEDVLQVIVAGPGFRSSPLPLRGRWLNLAGRLSLMESVSLALLAERVIAADTGPAHLAALLGASIIGCFGPTRVARTGLRGREARNVESACGGCFRRSCAVAPVCMAESLEQALELIAGEG